MQRHFLSRPLRRRVVLLFCLLSTLLPISLHAVPKAPDTCRVGIFITNLYDFDLANDSFTAQFWIWSLVGEKSESVLSREAGQSLEILDSRSTVGDGSLFDEEVKNGTRWATKKYLVSFQHNWDVTNYPFDRQSLRLRFEESKANVKSLLYVADTIQSAYDTKMSLGDWRLTSFTSRSTISTTQTTYGDPALTVGNSTSYSGVEFNLTLQRVNTGGLFFKLFTGVYIAFLISCVVFFIDPLAVDPRFGLSVGSLFAAVGNKYIVDSLLPQTSEFTLVDKIHDLTFAFIFLTVVVSAFSLYLAQQNRVLASKRLDRWGVFCLAVLFIIANGALILLHQS